MDNKPSLTVKEASILCYEMRLPRSTKSLRRWCAKDDVEAHKRQTSHGEKWFINRESLEIKIKEELEFLKHSEKPTPSPGQSLRHTPDMSGHDRTQANESAHRRTRPDVSAQGTDIAEQPTIRELQDQILILKADKSWRDQVLNSQKQALEKALEKSEAQSRYIGHLETKVIGAGQTPDQTFLAAPVPKSASSEDSENTLQLIKPEIIPKDQPHLDQSNLYTG